MNLFDRTLLWRLFLRHLLSLWLRSQTEGGASSRCHSGGHDDGSGVHQRGPTRRKENKTRPGDGRTTNVTEKKRLLRLPWISRIRRGLFLLQRRGTVLSRRRKWSRWRDCWGNSRGHYFIFSIVCLLWFLMSNFRHQSFMRWSLEENVNLCRGTHQFWCLRE